MTSSHAISTHDQVDEMISAAVRGLIAQQRTTAPQVALAVGIGRSTFFNKLTGAAPWKASEVAHLARHFDVTLDSLYEGRAEFRRSTSLSVHDYGSEGWGFESLRARPDHTPWSPAHSPHRRRTDRRRQRSVVPLYLVSDTPPGETALIA